MEMSSSIDFPLRKSKNSTKIVNHFDSIVKWNQFYFRLMCVELPVEGIETKPKNKIFKFLIALSTVNAVLLIPEHAYFYYELMDDPIRSRIVGKTVKNAKCFFKKNKLLQL